MAEVEQPGAAPPQAQSSVTPPKSPSKSSTKGKEEKKKYPQTRQELVKHYGLSIRDHFIRDCIKKRNLDDTNPDLDTLFEEAISQTLTSIAEPYLPQDLITANNKKNKGNYKGIAKLKGLSCLQVYSSHDVSKSQQAQNTKLDTGSDKSRMLHLVLTDGKNKVNAVEYQHIVLLELISISTYPCTHYEIYEDHYYLKLKMSYFDCISSKYAAIIQFIRGQRSNLKILR